MSNSYQSEHRFLDAMPQRKHLRREYHNYSSPGNYFITICTKRQSPWLANISENALHLSAAGEIVQEQWKLLPGRFPGLETDQFVVMPNHLHGIIVLTEHLCYKGPAKKSKPSLSDIIDLYKGAATYLIRRTTNIDEFAWQQSFYDIIVRNEEMLHNIRHYIAANPERWISDRFYNPNSRTGL